MYFCSEYHSLEMMKRMYSVEEDNHRSIATTKGTLFEYADQNDIDLEDILPPEREIQRGRKRKNRIESQSTSNRVGGQHNQSNVVCPVCNLPGHRRENCRVNNGAQWAM